MNPSFSFLVALLPLALAACGADADEARLGAHAGTATFHAYGADGATTSELVDAAVIDIAAGAGRTRTVSVPVIACTVSATVRGDGQYEALTAIGDCDVARRVAGRSALVEGTEGRLVGGNVSFHEGGDGDPFFTLHGTLVRDAKEVGTWTWTFESPRR